MDHRTRLAYVVSQFPETHESFIVREVRALAALPDIDLTIFSLKPCRDRIIQEEAKPLLKITRYPSAGATMRGTALMFHKARARRCVVDIVRHYRRTPSGLTKALVTVLRAAAIAPQLDGLGRPHVHAHWATMPALAGYFLKYAAGHSYSLTAHAWDIYADTTMLREKIEAAEFVVTCTGANREYLTALAGGSTPIVLSYHGLDFERIPSPRFERQGMLDILAVGRLVEQKGYQYLIDACGRLASRGRAFRCRIIGGGPLRESLLRQIRHQALDGLVALVGVQPLSHIFEAYRQATVLCVPSVVARDGDRDGLPNVIIEAMSQGLPVVASRVSGIPEVVRDGETGWLLTAGDADALADACEAVVSDRGEARRRAESAFNLVRREFDAATNAAGLVRLFRGTNAGARGRVTP